MSTGDSPVDRFAAELRRLYAAAGSPVRRILIKQAAVQEPAVHLNDSSLSDWLNGRSVPSDVRKLKFVTDFLQALARKRGGYESHPFVVWERLHSEALEARKVRRGGRPGVATPNQSGLYQNRSPLLDEVGDTGWRRPSGQIPTGLPGELASFSGRHRLLNELHQRISQHKPGGIVVAIHAIDGMAGVGKTSLALHIAHHYVDRYPDGAISSTCTAIPQALCQ